MLRAEEAFMRGRPHNRAPDYTDAALVMGGVNLIWIFMLLWAVFGFWSVLAAGAALNALIARLASRRARH